MSGERKHDPAPWSTTYAISLTKEQWTEELWGRFFKDITREIDTFPFREPVRLVVELLSLETDGEYPFHANWKIYSVSTSPETSSLPLTAFFWGNTKPYMEGRGNIIDVEPVFDAPDGEEIFMIGVEAVLRINNAAKVSSEIVDVWTDPDHMPLDWDDCSDSILAVME